jgi:hypothetical protein
MRDEASATGLRMIEVATAAAAMDVAKVAAAAAVERVT